MKFCLDATYFTFQNLTYKQKLGKAMGSPVSVTVASNGRSVRKTVKSYHTKIQICRRYVDDTFTVVPQDLTEDFHLHINSMERTIKFTKEMEEGGKMSHVDALVS